LNHGLSIPVNADPVFQADIDRLAKVISRDAGEREISQFVRDAAESQIELLRIRNVRAGLLNILISPAIDGFPKDDAVKTLASLERYERRATSRRKRALRATLPGN
jgi:hypothetical protein